MQNTVEIYWARRTLTHTFPTHLLLLLRIWPLAYLSRLIFPTHPLLHIPKVQLNQMICHVSSPIKPCLTSVPLLLFALARLPSSDWCQPQWTTSLSPQHPSLGCARYPPLNSGSASCVDPYTAALITEGGNPTPQCWDRVFLPEFPGVKKDTKEVISRYSWTSRFL